MIRRGVWLPWFLALATACGSDAVLPQPRIEPVDVGEVGADAAADRGGDRDGHGGDLGIDTPDASDADLAEDFDLSVDPDVGDADVVDLSVTLTADAGASLYAEVGAAVVLDGSGSRGAVAYSWHFGNGTSWDLPRSTPTAEVTYDEPGRYRAVLTVYDDVGNRHSDGVVVTVTEPLSFVPRASGSVWRWNQGATERVAVVSPDAGTLTIARRQGDSFSVERRIDVCAEPRSVADWNGILVVTCPEEDALVVASNTSLPPQTFELPYGSRPSAALGVGEQLFVTYAGDGVLVRFEQGAEQIEETGRWHAVDDPRGLAELPGGRLAVSRWRSPDHQGELAIVDPATSQVHVVPLAIDPQRSSDTESGGLPSYLDVIAVSPTGRELALPSLQANTIEGSYVNGTPLSHQTTLRAIVSYVDIATDRAELATSYVEDFERRFLFDDRGLASAAVYSSHGDFLFVATRGSRSVERLDTLTGALSGSVIDIGYAPQGLARSADDRYLYVDAALSRELVVLDVSDIAARVTPVARLPLVDAEPLSPVLLRGAQLFNDSLDTRLARDGYIACAHCHLDGESDRRTWDFTDRGEGMRDTITLRGRAGLAHGPLHWSGNFDEVQDFEHDIRGPFQGTGLLADADFFGDGRDEPLGGAKAGWSEDLDALAAYVSSLRAYPRSPYRGDAGELSESALAGRDIFRDEIVGCAGCHAGPQLTDSAFIAPGVPRLHDVGTLGPGSGQRLGGALSGLDTPTLHGLWNTPPYLHDGSAGTLDEVVGARNASDLHGVTTHLDETQRAQLVEYLLSLDGPRE